MDFTKAEKIYVQIITSQLTDLASKLIKSGIRYARIRVDWYLLSMKDRMDFDKERTHAHNAFISSCDILARNMKKQGEDNSWRKTLGNERKVIGDFARLLHALLGIKAR